MRKRICTKCRVEKIESKKFFNYINRPSYKGFEAQCKDCRNHASKNYYRTQRNKANQWKSFLKRRYGLTPKQYNTLLEEQHGLCKLCRLPLGNKFDVDHNHKTGQVRGLLCRACNLGLGMFKDDVSLLQRAVQYILTNG